MDITTATQLLKLLGSGRGNAMTSKEIWGRWRNSGGGKVSERSIQRYMMDLSIESADGPPPLVNRITDDKAFKYHLAPSQVANWFLTEEAALHLQLTRQTFGKSFGLHSRLNTDKLADIAEEVINASIETKRIRNRLRIVPDGIGRLPVRIDPLILKTVIESIGENKKIKISYESASKRDSEQIVNPLGLVAKDGNIYLVAVAGLSGSPRHYALNRFVSAEKHFHMSQADPNFNLDDYIDQTHQFSHPLDFKAPPVVLKLRVDPKAYFHFYERRLSQDQEDTSPKTPGDWYIVTATVPVTIQLYPFLLSMGPWIEILEPQSVRAEVAKWARGIHSHYRNDKS